MVVAVATPTWAPAERKRPWLYHSAGNCCRFWSRKTKTGPRHRIVSLTVGGGALLLGDHLRLVHVDPVPVVAEAAVEGSVTVQEALKVH